jgi:hypothetical protein
MKHARFLWTLGVLTLLSSTGVQATPIAIDLNDFFADPTVTVAADGSSALLEEDPPFAAVLLSNDPGLGDPDVIIPGADISVVFEYDFAEGAGENDEFGAFVIDAATGLSAGASYEFFVQESSNGLVEIDISALDGLTLGLQFQLTNLPLPFDSGTSSTVTVSNVQLVTAAVPEPATLLLLGSGLFVLIQIKRS